MTDSTDLQVTVELQDAATVTTDVLVIPSTTQGSFGEPWLSVVGRLGLLPSRSPIPLGDLRIEPVWSQGGPGALCRLRGDRRRRPADHADRQSPGSVRRWDG